MDVASDREKILARFWPKVNKDGPMHPTLGTACWLWTASTDRSGYGNFRTGTGNSVAHKFSYEAHVGLVAEGLDLDHLCRTRRCVRPGHLEPVSHRENCRRSTAGSVNAARQEAKLLCPKGHPYSGENLYLDRKGWRGCRTCRRASDAKRRTAF